MKIYADNAVSKWHLTKLNFEVSLEILAGCPAVFQMPFPYNKDFETKINQALEICSCVVVLVSELHAESVEFIQHNQNPKLHYFTCGFVQGVDTGLWMDWFITTGNFYKQNTLLEQLFPYRIKSRAFDILLGWTKPHRQQIYDYVLAHKLTPYTIMTYLEDRSLPLQKQLADSWIWPNIDVPKQKVTNTISDVNYQGQNIALSQIIPLDIYNQSTYSVVAETNYDNHYSFYTEKIVKPILAKRLFIVFSGQHYLRNLRRLGFQTFDGIIDETYDTVEDPQQRFALALEQMQLLINTPQDQVLEQIQPIIEHNQRLMLETDWYGDFARELRAVLLDHAGQN